MKSEESTANLTEATKKVVELEVVVLLKEASEER